MRGQQIRMTWGLALLALTWLMVEARFSTVAHAADRYESLVLEDEPVAYWRFEGKEPLRNQVAEDLPLTKRGRIDTGIAGPRPSEYPDFSKENTAIVIPRGSNYLVAADPGDACVLDFTTGDAITMEAWIRIDAPLVGTYPYIIGKGRTHNAGFSTKNQNYALRLANKPTGVFLSFLFVDADGNPKDGIGDDGHRWTSTVAIPDDGGWHHVALSYEFGDADSLHGYIDGEEVAGKWDMGGKTDRAPIVDNDELWIGSAVGGRSSLGAELDEVAIYRKALSAERIRAHCKIDLSASPYVLGQVDPATVPGDHVRVEIVERVPRARTWKFRLAEPQLLYETDVFALKQLPHKYNSKGLIIDRPIPALLQLSSKVKLEAGAYEFLLRSVDAARLYIDGELVAETPFMSLRSDAHQPYYELPDYGPDLLSIPAGHAEKRVTVELDEGQHVFTLVRLLGNKGRGNYLGEMSVGYGRPGERLQFLSPSRELPYTDAGWLQFLEEDDERRRVWNQQQRLAADEAERAYWEQRHAWAREVIGEGPQPPQMDGPHVYNEVDQFLAAAHASAADSIPALADDWSFLRRVCLDVIGTIPTPEMIDEFFSQPVETRRSWMIDRLLADRGWADHWVGYWEDVLAENPGLTKPMLNNSGPFRFYLYEAFLDGRPMDRIVHELIMQEGSAYTGGPAGFGIASQNDVPMAAKAHILGTAFLAVEMKCARCHDAPYHDVAQKDLFSMAAMLRRSPQKVPGTSSIPLTPEEIEKMVVNVTLEPGSSVKPDWPFVEFVSLNSKETGPPAIPGELLRSPSDTREQLAAAITSPHNTRFAKVMANRVWQRLMGRGLVEPVDDWEEAERSHPELLEYLAHVFVAEGYDLKAVARLILNSHVYQREPVEGAVRESELAARFYGPVRRKMTGEQLVDSLHVATGKGFGSEELTMDGDAKRPDKTFGHLGIPQRSWELVAVSNERDRPSMSLPVAQSIIDLLTAFGWRQQRQDPITIREDPLTPLQPMALANGANANRVVDFSDDSGLTQLALEEQTVETFVDGLFERILTRPARSDEREILVELLREGYADRVVAGPEVVPPKRIFRTGITWSTHFAPEADVEAMRRQREVLEGDKPTVRLAADWRERAEDVVWTLINSPEFVFVP